MTAVGNHLRALAAVLALAATACTSAKEDPKTCEPACDATRCMTCDVSGAAPVCVSACGDGLACNAGRCMVPEAPTCAQPCGPCQICDLSGATPACKDLCGDGLTCEAGRCVKPQEATCEGGCDPCEMCDTSGAAAACVALCSAGLQCESGKCVAPPAPACDPACGPCQVCDLSGAAPACKSTCGAGEYCDAAANACRRESVHAHMSALAGPFADGPAVTAACLKCHDEAGEQMIRTAHWNYVGPTPNLEGHTADTHIGKKNIINNFCVALPSNEKRCSECHAGYGWADKNFDFTNKGKVDCLVCHADPAVGYFKEQKEAGAAGKTLDLVLVARSAARPQRANCGFCHFRAGGGDNVKQGDLGSYLTKPSPAADAHMGNGMHCADCHAGAEHKLKGQGVQIPVAEGRVHCTDCHAEAPHTGGQKALLDNHALDVACQSCHIPAFSRQKPTKMVWDWSTAGNKTRGTAGVETATLADGSTVTKYDFMKGDFVWEKSVRPVYAWYDGGVSHKTVFDAFSNAGTEQDPIVLAAPTATKASAGAKIHPFKFMKGKQPVRVDKRYVIAPNTFGPNGFWGKVTPLTTYDQTQVEGFWTTALNTGARAAGQLAQGEPDMTRADWTWAETRMYLAINHEVAPKSAALGCTSCHGNAAFDFAKLGYTCDPMTGGDCGKRH